MEQSIDKLDNKRSYKAPLRSSTVSSPNKLLKIDMYNHKRRQGSYCIDPKIDFVKLDKMRKSMILDD